MALLGRPHQWRRPKFVISYVYVSSVGEKISESPEVPTFSRPKEFSRTSVTRHTFYGHVQPTCFI